jgi:hypothetical protein
MSKLNQNPMSSLGVGAFEWADRTSTYIMRSVYVSCHRAAKQPTIDQVHILTNFSSKINVYMIQPRCQSDPMGKNHVISNKTYKRLKYLTTSTTIPSSTKRKKRKVIAVKFKRHG